MDNNLIFISYSNKDIEIVSPIVEAIEEIGVFFGANCWFQPNNSKKDFINSIGEGIEHSNFFICFVL